MDEFLRMAIAIFSAALFGWTLFSVAAGLIVYLSTLTTNHVSLEMKSMNRAESNTLLQAHTRDPVIMKPLNEAKARWYVNQDKNLFTTLTIPSADGLQLSAFYWESSSPARGKTVLIVHGMYDSAAGMGYLAEEYHAKGWNVLSIDQRSHGESEGTKRTMGVRESSDLGLWIDVLICRFKAPEIWLHGVSMGGAAVLLYSERIKQVPSPVRGIIADSSYASYEATFSRLLQLVVRSRFLVWSILRGTSVACFILSGVSFSAMNPQKQLAKIDLPLLLFHGQQDQLVPIGQVRHMLNETLKRGSGSVVVIPGAPHIGAYFYAPSLYMEKIEEFCRRNT